MSDVAERLWLRARVLIIDEISMIDGSLLDKVEKIARNVRQKQARFGGIQVREEHIRKKSTKLTFLLVRSSCLVIFSSYHPSTEKRMRNLHLKQSVGILLSINASF